jgi:hypothetical protein
VPARLADAKGEPVAFERRDVRRLVARIGDGQIDVDDRFGGQIRDARRSDVLDRERSVSERIANTTSGGRGLSAALTTAAVRP